MTATSDDKAPPVQAATAEGGLLPCPFHAPFGHDRWPHPVDMGRTHAQWQVVCPCGVVGPVRSMKHEAIAVWNRRPVAPAGA